MKREQDKREKQSTLVEQKGLMKTVQTRPCEAKNKATASEQEKKHLQLMSRMLRTFGAVKVLVVMMLAEVVVVV